MQEAEEAVGALVATSGDTAGVFDLAEEALDPALEDAGGSIDRALDFPVGLRRDRRLRPSALEIGPDRIAVMALVCEQRCGVWRIFGHQIGIGCDVGRLFRRQMETDGETVRIRPGVDFGREAARCLTGECVHSPRGARTANAVLMNPPSAGCMLVRSDYSAVDHLRRIVRGFAFGQRREDHIPDGGFGPAPVFLEDRIPVAESRRSRQGAPVRAIQNTASRAQR